MSVSGETNISSFLIRFVEATQPAAETSRSYRGVIRHIQSGDELAFTRWSEAANFIQHFFPIDDLDSRPVPNAGGIGSE